jgi:branched-chain amino acid transport system permease protein
MLYFVQQLLNGLHAGSLYALLAFGYVITNGVLHRTNLAYGPIFAFCGHSMILATVFAYDGLWIVLPLSILFGTILAFGYAAMASSVLSRFVLEPLAGRSPNTVVAATLGVAIVLMELSRIAADTKDVWLPPILGIPVDFAPPDGFRVTLTVNQLLGCATVLCAVALGTFVLNFSAFGRRWRAVADDPLAAAMCGVDVTSTFRHSVLAGALAAALTGVLAALYYGNISFGTGMIYGLKILFVTAAGSYSSPLRGAIGAACYGIGEALWTGYFPGEWRDGWMLAFLVAILILREPEADNRPPASA